jgi:hypothetical protein
MAEERTALAAQLRVAKVGEQQVFKCTRRGCRLALIFSLLVKDCSVARQSFDLFFFKPACQPCDSSDLLRSVQILGAARIGVGPGHGYVEAPAGTLEKPGDGPSLLSHSFQ